jgi:hypothetical protein
VPQNGGSELAYLMPVIRCAGYLVYAEYQYQNLHQSAFNFVTNAIGSSANNSTMSQCFVLGNIVIF